MTPAPDSGATLVVATTATLDDQVLAAARALCERAFGGSGPDDGFDDDDWAHALGGIHVLARDGEGAVIGHAAVVRRVVDAGGTPWRCGYVEAVAVAPDHQGRGIGSDVMAVVSQLVRDGHDLGVLGTGRTGFYVRLGWEPWRGTSWVRDPGTARLRRTAEDDDALMVLRHGRSAGLDLRGPLVARARPGDDW